MTTPRVTMPVRTTVRLIQRTKLPPKYPPCSAPAAMTEPYSPGDWQRFPCERRLIYADVVALNKFAVGRDNIAKVQANDISGHKRLSIDLLPFFHHEARALSTQGSSSTHRGRWKLHVLPKTLTRR